MSRNKTIVMGLLCLCMAVFFIHIRTSDMSSRALWADEAGQAWLVASPSVGVMYERSLAWDRHPPLYSFALYGLAKFGTGETMLRSLSVLAGIASLLSAFWMARAWLAPFGAVCCTLLFGASCPFALYSREARPYALALLALTLFYWALGRHLKLSSPRTAAALALAALFSVSTLYASSVVVLTTLAVAFVAVWMGQERRPSTLAGLWPAVMTVVAANIVLYVYYLGRYAGLSSTSEMYCANIPVHSSAFVTLAAFFKETVSLCAYFMLGDIYGPRWQIISMGVGILFFLLLGIGVLGFSARRGMVQIIGCSLCLMLAMFMGLAMMRLHPYGPGRHCVILAPAAFILVSAGLSMIHDRIAWLAWGGLALFMAVGAASFLKSPTPNYMVEDLPSVLNDVDRLIEPGDVLVIPEDSAPAFDYYKGRFAIGNWPSIIYDKGIHGGENAPFRPDENSAQGRYWLVFAHCSDEEIADLEAPFVRIGKLDANLRANGASASCWRIAR